MPNVRIEWQCTKCFRTVTVDYLPSKKEAQRRPRTRFLYCPYCAQNTEQRRG